ncbi:LemA family protein [Metamycoplasma hyosynoviae]|uniref:LemA family protein n=1 Tax=Metamycoplasma hyosynoviae TaxID=29559 RepID=UPI0023588C26|nr:LemA family protein [Metamycoplasma hyosynoviae]MDC8912001.1 LemA family protein [Metamycoplasma hyosynoviae]
MLFDTRNEQPKEGFRPNIDNREIPAKANGAQKFGVIFLFIITLGLFGIAYIIRKNEYRRKQSEIIQASATIQAAQKKRTAILQAMLDTVKGYAKHEKDTLTNVTKLRSRIDDANKEKDPTKTAAILDEVRREINIQLESYPELKSEKLFMQLQTQIVNQEDEIYAAIRIYNQKVSAFNSEIYNFWTVYVCEKLQISNFPYFAPPEEEMKPVSMESLWK